MKGTNDAPQDNLDEEMRNQYMVKARKEVDFHHKVAYRFEKVYKLGKKQALQKAQVIKLNQEIIEVITEHSDYID